MYHNFFAVEGVFLLVPFLTEDLKTWLLPSFNLLNFPRNMANEEPKWIAYTHANTPIWYAIEQQSRRGTTEKEWEFRGWIATTTCAITIKKWNCSSNNERCRNSLKNSLSFIYWNIHQNCEITSYRSIVLREIMR